MTNEPAGIFDKYEVKHLEGETAPQADYFVLRLDTDHNARVAAIAYAVSCSTSKPQLARDLLAKVAEYDTGLQEQVIANIMTLIRE